MDKKLLLIIVLLIPLTIVSFFFKETNFNISKNQEEENKQSVDNLKVQVLKDNQKLNVDLEDYVIGVVAGEMPALFELEALKAQAIASRTYVINHMTKNESITATTDDQVYNTEEEMKNKWQDKYDEYYQKIKTAVTSTKGLIMKYHDIPIKAYYYSMSNGYTESSINVFNEENDYLQSISSPWDEDNSNTIKISKEDFCTKLSITCDNITIKDIKKDESNRVSNITINNKVFTGLEVRKKLNLRSTDFTFNILDSDIEIITKGYGHGVGMSQYGANYMAKEGYNYEEILKYYYQDIEIDNI